MATAANPPSFPELYERKLVGPLFRPWAEAILDIVAPAAGERVLDVACGTGIVGRLASERVGPTGRVVGVDLSPGMLAMARAVAPSIEWREGNAVALPRCVAWPRASSARSWTSATRVVTHRPSSDSTPWHS